MSSTQHGVATQETEASNTSELIPSPSPTVVEDALDLNATALSDDKNEHHKDRAQASPTTATSLPADPDPMLHRRVVLANRLIALGIDPSVV